jgi:nucleolin
VTFICTLVIDDSGNLRGYGHVEYTSASSATKALDRSGEYLGDRYLTIERPMNPRQLDVPSSSGAGGAADSSKGGSKVEEKVKPPGCRSIFLKNLPYDVTEEELTETFRVYGPITR